MRAKTFGVVVLIFATAYSGCGGENSSSDASREAQEAVRRFVDTDNCDYASNAYVSELAPTEPDADAARKACTRDDSYEGLRQGEYKVRSAVASGDDGTVVLALDTGETRKYDVVREDGKWRVDDFKEKSSTTKHRLKDTVKFADGYELNGEGLDVRLDITPISFTSSAAPPYALKPEPGGTWWRLRARVASRSSGAVTIDSADFVVRDQKGQSFEGGTDYQPRLGNSGQGVSPGENQLGYVSFNLAPGSRPAELLYKPAVSEGKRIIWILR